jgi:hypothetical protein
MNQKQIAMEMTGITVEAEPNSSSRLQTQMAMLNKLNFPVNLDSTAGQLPTYKTCHRHGDELGSTPSTAC